MREAWSIAEFKDFWSICVSNLLDKSEYETHPLFKSTVPTTFEKLEKAEWNITKDNIAEEEGRTESSMSFYFVLKWFSYEIQKKEQKSDRLLSNVIDKKHNTNSLTEID